MDRWGFSWIANQDGICRFDGKRFVNYSNISPPEHRLGGTDVREIIEDKARNLLWALPTGRKINGISTVTGKVEKSITIPDLGREDYNLSMLMCGNELWIGTSTGVRIYDSRENRFLNSPLVSSKRHMLTDFAVRSMYQDERGNVWVCYGGYGICIYQQATKALLKTISLAELNDHKQMNEIRISSGVFLAPGHLLLATSQGLREVTYEKGYNVNVDSSPCFSLPTLNFENIDWISRMATGEFLIAGYNGLYRFDSTLLQYYVLKDKSETRETDWLSSVSCVYQDKEGDLWLGCQQGLGYISGKKTPFHYFSHDPLSVVRLSHVFAVAPVGKNNILVGLRNGLVQINTAIGKYVLHDETHLYQHIFTDHNKKIHVSRPDGLFIFDSRKIIPIDKVYPEFKQYASYSINSHLFVNDTLVILGTENNRGLLLWNPTKHWVKNLNPENSPTLLTTAIVNNIFRDSQGRFWILSDNTISILSPDLQSKKEVVISEKNSREPYKLFFDMCEVNGSYWVASYGSGIIQLRSDFSVKQVFNTENGLSNNGVYQIYPLLGNALLVTTNNGLSRIDLATAKITRYYQNDGLHSNAFEEVSGTRAEGKIYAGGVNGFTVIDPANFTANTTPPKLYFTNVEMKTSDGFTTDTANLQMQAITIENNVVQTTIRFTGLNYRNPDRTQYAYRIAEESGQWISIGTQNFISLISHAPGTYTLWVKAINEDGVPSEVVKLTLYFQPKWYQTKLFWGLMVLLFTVAVYQLYRFRIRQYRREENIRRRLARDLHDDLGSTMNSINIYTHLALMEDSTNRYLKQINQGAQEAVAGIRDIIWILDDHKDTVGELADRISRFAHPLCEANQISFTVQTDPASTGSRLGKEEKRNLHMILKEAINNSIKYAEAKNLTLHFQGETGKLSIVIADDGRGFDNATLKRGNGLNNMALRATEIGYRVSINSVVREGTTIRLQKK